MKKIFIVFSVILFLCFLTSTVHANLLVNGDFEDATGIASNAVVWESNYIPTGAEKFLNVYYDVGVDEGQWLDWRQWARVDGTDNFNLDAPAGYSNDHFAYHAIQYNTNSSGAPVIYGNNDLLFQGVYFSSGLSAGTPVTLSFDYILNLNTGSWADATAYVLGFTDGGYLENNAPFNASFDGVDPKVALSSYTYTPLKEILGATPQDTWSPMSYTFNTGENYDALVVAFNFGGKDDILEDRYGTIFAGIDNVSLSVPEPGTMILLGFGLIGLAALRRKK